MQRLTDMSTSELIQFAGQHSASIKEVGIYSELMKELTTRLCANTLAVTQALKERDEARLELSSAQLTISQITKVMGTSETLSTSEQVSALNQQVVNLAVENASMLRLLTDISENHDEFVNEADEHMYASVPLDYVSEINMYVSRDVNAENPFAATDAAIANIQAQGVEKFAANEREWAAHWEKHGVTDGSVSRCLMVAQDADKFAAQLRKEPNHD